MSAAREGNQRDKVEDTPRSREDDAPERSEESSSRKPEYLFKIVPADPKNSFDFEDVADK